MHPINKHFGSLFGFVRDIAQGRMGASKEKYGRLFYDVSAQRRGLRRSVGTTERVMGKRTSTRCVANLSLDRGGGEQADNQPKRGLCGRRAARLMLMEEGLCLGAFMRQGQKVDGSKAEQRVRSRVQKEVTRAKRRVRCHRTKSEILGEG